MCGSCGGNKWPKRAKCYLCDHTRPDAATPADPVLEGTGTPTQAAETAAETAGADTDRLATTEQQDQPGTFITPGIST